MKKLFMSFFSVTLIAIALFTSLWAVELVMTARGTPILFDNAFWESQTIESLFDTFKVENIGEFLSGVLIGLQLLCVAVFTVCAIIGSSITKPMRKYSSIKEYQKFIRGNLLLYRIGTLLFVFVFIAHIWEAFITYAGEFTPIIFTCLILGLPGLLFMIFTMPTTIDAFVGILPKGYCRDCNHGSSDQYRLIDRVHTHDVVTTRTTSRWNDNAKRYDTTSRTSSTRRFYNETYACRNCGDTHTDEGVEG